MNLYANAKSNYYHTNADYGQRNVYPVAHKRIYKNLEAHRRATGSGSDAGADARAKIDSVIRIFRGALVNDASANIVWDVKNLI